MLAVLGRTEVPMYVTRTSRDYCTYTSIPT